jgi:hypothetical protein
MKWRKRPKSDRFGFPNEFREEDQKFARDISERNVALGAEAEA